MAFATLGPETHSGITTSWLPLTTAGPYISDCFNTFWANTIITTTAPPTLTGLFVFSNLKNFPAPTISVQCLPTEITQWLDQSSASGVERTSLGPIVCPSAYYVAQTIQLSTGASTFCCPTSYTLTSLGSTSACLLPAGNGRSLVWFGTDTDEQWVSTTRTLQLPITLKGDLIEGFNLVEPTQAPLVSTTGSTSLGSNGGSSSNSGPTSSSGSSTSSGSSSSSGSSTGSGFSSRSGSSSSSEIPNNLADTGGISTVGQSSTPRISTIISNVPQQSSAVALPSKNLSSGATIGISVGSSVLFLSILGIVFFIWRYRRRRLRPKANPQPSQPTNHDDWRRIPEQDVIKTHRMYDLDRNRPPFELNNGDKRFNSLELDMEGKKKQCIYEMYGQEVFEMSAQNGKEVRQEVNHNFPPGISVSPYTPQGEEGWSWRSPVPD